MKNHIIPKMAMVIIALRLMACTCPECPQQPVNPRPNPDASSIVKIVNPPPAALTPLSYSIPLVDSLSVKLNKDPKYSSDVPKLENNVWQYIFLTDSLTMRPGDTWYIHKAYDQGAHKVCFVLEITNQGMPTKYYKGSVNCPRICGFLLGGLSPEALMEYNTNLLQPLQREQAQALMQNPQVNCAHSININWNQGIEYSMRHRAVLIQLIYGLSDMDSNPLFASFFPLDEHGNCMGGSWKIPDSQICIYHAGNDCSLLQ